MKMNEIHIYDARLEEPQKNECEILRKTAMCPQQDLDGTTETVLWNHFKMDRLHFIFAHDLPF